MAIRVDVIACVICMICMVLIMLGLILNAMSDASDIYLTQRADRCMRLGENMTQKEAEQCRGME